MRDLEQNVYWLGTARRPHPGYPGDVTDEEWTFVDPYLLLIREVAPQRQHPLREMFSALRDLVYPGAPGRYPPNYFPPWEPGEQQTQRWLASGPATGAGSGVGP